MDWPKEMQLPSIQVTWPATCSRNSSSRRDLPIPASPTTNTTWPRPARAAAKARWRVPSASSRPTKGVSPWETRAARRVTCPRARSNSHAATGRARFLTVNVPSWRSSK